MNSSQDDSRFWPFPENKMEATTPAAAQKIVFLKAAFDAGAQSYKFGINNSGAKSDSRSGIILERGRKRWELRLYEGNIRIMSAFVACFLAAGQAVISWLMGCTVERILDEVHEHLVAPPGLKESYTIYDAEER